MNWLEALPRNRRRGSFPRCLLLMDGDPSAVAERLTSLVGLDGVHVSNKDFWMPQGLPFQAEGGWDTSPIVEARLGKAPKFLTDEQRETVTSWWLMHRRRANTPNWDIASTATIEGRPGLILIEAKAHSGELKVHGKEPGNKDNEKKIGAAIQQANTDLNTILPGWALSKDSHYQLTNRFAWAWKIASLGVPAILVYLGFLRAEEMGDQGMPFADGKAWEGFVRDYSQGIVPEAAWNTQLSLQGTPLQALVRSIWIWPPRNGHEADAFEGRSRGLIDRDDDDHHDDDRDHDNVDKEDEGENPWNPMSQNHCHWTLSTGRST
jgi:hypothetical protein